MKTPIRITSFFFSILLLLSTLPVIASAANAQHPLLNGALEGEEAEARLFEFIREMNREKNTRKPRHWIYSEFIDDIGITRTKKYLEAVDPFCHGVSHELGELIGQKEPALDKGMQLCSDTCTYGCVHGVFKVYFSKLGKDYHGSQQHDHGGSSAATNMDKKSKLSASDLDKFGLAVNKACENPTGVVEDFFRGNCAHGVGHAMGMLAKDVSQATEYCDVFDKKIMRYYCETGVFMELTKKIEKQLFSKASFRHKRLEASIEYCSQVSQMPSACLRFLPPLNRNLTQVKYFSALCDKETGTSRKGCFNGMGFSSRGYLAENPDKVNEICNVGDSKDRESCVSGFAYMKKGNVLQNDITKACHKLTDKGLRELCLDQSQRYYYQVENKAFKEML